MLRLCVSLILVVAVAYGARTGLVHKIPAPCVVSDWDAWGECNRAKLCPSELPQEMRISYAQPHATQAYDDGRAHMNILRRAKSQIFAERDSCRIKGLCTDPLPQQKAEALCENGFAGEYPCRNVDLLRFMDFESMGSTYSLENGNDIWGWTDPEDGHEYSIMGMRSGTSFVRVTDPANPEALAFLPTRTSNSDWRDIKVYANHAFIVSEAGAHGMQVYDLTQLRTMEGKPPADIPRVDATAEYSLFGNAHNIAINEETGFAYVIGQTASSGGYSCTSPGGLHMINIQDPNNPQYAGCFNDDGYTHDAECIVYRGPDVEHFEREICFNSNENTLTIVDVTDKSNPVMLSRTGYTGYAYTHQNWITEDHTVLLLDDELDEMFGSDKRTRTYIWDVTDLDSPELKNTHYSTETSIDHNQYIKGDFTYQSNYEAGLRILHINQAEFELTETGYFDVRPDRTTITFAGTWSNYPYFSSGTVIVSSIDYGLFILRPNVDAMYADMEAATPYGEQTRQRHVVSTSASVECPHLAETRKCNPGHC